MHNFNKIDPIFIKMVPFERYLQVAYRHKQYLSYGVYFISQSMKYSLKMAFFATFHQFSKFQNGVPYCCFGIFSKFLHRCAQKSLNFQKIARPKRFYEVHILVPHLPLYFIPFIQSPFIHWE